MAGRFIIGVASALYSLGGAHLRPLRMTRHPPQAHTCLHAGVNLAAPLVGHFIIGVASALYLPALFGYVSTLKQQAAGAATGAAQVRGAKTSRGGPDLPG